MLGAAIYSPFKNSSFRLLNQMDGIKYYSKEHKRTYERNEVENKHKQV